MRGQSIPGGDAASGAAFPLFLPLFPAFSFADPGLVVAEGLEPLEAAGKTLAPLLINQLLVGPGRYCSLRHEIPCNSRNYISGFSVLD